MAKKRKSAKRKSLKREDIHAHPRQGVRPYHGPAHHGNPVEDQPMRFVPILMDSHVAGVGGFTTGNPNLRAPFYGFAPRNYQKTDQQILNEVCERLTLHGELDVRDIDVHCRNGVIRLEGSVPSRWMRRAIEAVTESVYGVADVEDELEIEKAD